MMATDSTEKQAESPLRGRLRLAALIVIAVCVIVGVITLLASGAVDVFAEWLRNDLAG
jgi:hypothetical protein